MDLDDPRVRRMRLGGWIAEAHPVFHELGRLDNEVYSEGLIDKKRKELMEVEIFVANHCDESILHHVDGSPGEGASRAGIVEAVKLGVMAGGVIAFEAPEEADG